MRRPRFGLRGLDRLALLLGLFTLSASELRAWEYAFSEFNGTGFDYTFGVLEEEIGPTSVRLFDDQSGAGGAGIFYGEPGFDLSSFADSHVEVDFTVAPGNTARLFEFELYDVNLNSVKWRFDLLEAPVGQPLSALSTNTLANPEIINLYDENSGPFDLSRVRQMQMVGDYNSSVTSFDVSFDRISIENGLPEPPPYAGAEPDAAWRTEAATQIETHRKADLRVNVTDALGAPLPGAEVHVAMKRHEFGFGTAIATPLINGVGADEDIYRQKVVELFNTTTTENAVKWPPWAGDWGNNEWSQANTLAALDWLNAQGLEVRAHNMLWPGERWLPDEIIEMVQPTIDTGQPLDPAGQQALRDAIAARIADVAAATAGKVTAWDVVNEPRSNRLLMDALDEGYDALVDWFNLTRAADPNATLFLNEFDILSTSGLTDTAEQQAYFDTITDLLDAGAAIDSIGMQGHFVDVNGFLDASGPEELWAIYDRYAALGLAIEVTEFDFETTDEQLQADYMRDFLTATFAHDGVDGITQWGFWEGSHWRPDAAMFREDWTLKPNGQVYIDLVLDEWWTDELLASAAGGEAETRGFKGEYEVTVTLGGQTVVVPATLTEGGLVLDVALDLLPGDFNNDGAVDAADYAVWRNLLESETTAYGPGDANGDGQVDGDDYLIWRANYGLQVSSGAGGLVPEPASGGLLAVTLVAPLFGGCRRSTIRQCRRG